MGLNFHWGGNGGNTGNVGNMGNTGNNRNRPNMNRFPFNVNNAFNDMPVQLKTAVTQLVILLIMIYLFVLTNY